MRTLGKVAAVTGLIVLCLWVLVNTIWPGYTHRYRLICDIEVDGQSHTGSSVFEVTWQTQARISAMPWRVDVRGDAVFVDLGDRGALLIPNSRTATKEPSGASLEYLALWAFKGQLPPAAKYGITRPALTILSRVHGKANLVADELPQFVWLKDVNDPNSAQIVTPDQFSQVIGGNVHLNSVSVEMTDEKPTRHSLSSRLPWFDAMLGKERLERQKQPHSLQRGRAYQLYQLRAADLIGRED
tara:strand:+ start:1596 stop:2321 length:726 start_codon:yes stop_codon:yes gene_type:complete